MNNLTDAQVVNLYEKYSEETYAAGFMMLADNDDLKGFLLWLEGQERRDFTGYEQILIAKWRASHP